MHLSILHLKLLFTLMFAIKLFSVACLQCRFFRISSLKMYKIYFDAFNWYIILLFLFYYRVHATNFLFLDSIWPISSQQQIHNNITYLLIALTIIEYDPQHHQNNVNFFCWAIYVHCTWCNYILSTAYF